MQLEKNEQIKNLGKTIDNILDQMYKSMKDDANTEVEQLFF